MGEAFITHSGSGGGSFAVIGVTYPVGSTVTCSLEGGSTVLRAKDTLGYAIFKIPSIGTWKIESRLGEKVKEKSVEISHKNQAEKIEITYSIDLVKQPELISDCFVNDRVYITAEGNLFHRAQGPADTRWVFTNEKINLSEFTKLTIDVSKTNHVSGNYDGSCGFSQNQGSIGTGSDVIMLSDNIVGWAAGSTHTFDISDYNGEYYFNMRVRAEFADSFYKEYSSIRFE